MNEARLCIRVDWQAVRTRFGDFADILKQIRSGHAMRVEELRDGAIYFVKAWSLFERIHVLSDGRHLITAWPATRKLLERRRSPNSGVVGDLAVGEAVWLSGQSCHEPDHGLGDLLTQSPLSLFAEELVAE